MLKDLLIIVLAFSLNIDAYRYICNGILANGDERVDECGICDDEHAARWANPNIPVSVDNKSLPKTLSESDWFLAINNSFAAWNNIEGSNLHFFMVNQENKREFGTNEYNHEIFWINNKEEWRKLTGVGENNILGATLPRYNCDENSNKRVIFDADMVLNAVSDINWQIQCQDDDLDCASVQVTLVHELGHFFGLDHPCLLCSTSVMSAREGFNLKYPVFDDIKALRTLYPEGTGGNFGFPCHDGQKCSPGLSCINDHANSYCSNTCKDDNDCEFGTICSSDKSCIFVQGNMLGRNIMENCSRAPCKDSLVCAGAGSNDYYCYASCKNKFDCKNEESCMPLDSETSICIGVAQLGGQCNFTKLCSRGLFCVFDGNAGTCRKSCGANHDCGVGEFCQNVDLGYKLCLPVPPDLDLYSNTKEFLNQSTLNNGPKNEKKASGCSMLGDNESSLLLFILLLCFSILKINKQYSSDYTTCGR